jgi:hypothetical protein
MLRKVGVQQFCPVENGFVPGENTKKPFRTPMV